MAGIHINWFNTFQFARAYALGEGMKHYTEMVQEPEFAARDKGYTFVSHQQAVGAGHFDDVTTVIQDGSAPCPNDRARRTGAISLTNSSH